ncbi:MAG: ABC transporter ATP-binding protein [Christensenellales bacterium]|jgi:putative ABC transport system ATP-binding protein
MADMLKTVDVSRCFTTAGNQFWALRDINITAPAGKLTILKGRSGSGKTTLMNILGALDKPTNGQVYLGGEDIVKLDERRRGLIRRRSIGYVFQSVALIPMMSAYENVEYALRLAGMRSGRRERASECLKMVGLGQRMNHMPQEMSGGEQQRVAIARAIAHKPKVIFADEPTAELDTNTGLQVVKIFKDLCAGEGITIVMTTHDTGLMEIGDMVYELQDGEIVGK